MGHKLFLMEIKQRKSKEEFRDFNHTDFIEDEVKYKINSLENSLKLEQLRALENNISLMILKYEGKIHRGIDTPEDLFLIRKYLESE